MLRGLAPASRQDLRSAPRAWRRSRPAGDRLARCGL